MSSDVARSGRSRLSLILSAVAFVCSAIALGFALTAESRAYSRVVSETWAAAEPVYRDFGMKPPAQSPRSIAEVIGPLMRVSHDDSASGR
jgi:hypothetical protein